MKKILVGIAAVLVMAGCSSAPEDKPRVNEHTSWVTPSPTDTQPTYTQPPASDAPTNQPSPPATVFQPDEQAYVTFVRSRSVAVSALENQAIVDLGQSICGAFDRGASAQDVIRIMITEGIDSQSTAVFAAGAVIHLCPEHRLRVQGEVNR